MNTRLIGLETNVHRFTGVLESFLGRIQIDDGLRLVLDNRRIASVDPANITLDFHPDAADNDVINIDSTVSEPNPLGSDPMNISDDDEAPSDLPTFVAGTASTPSNTLGDIQMDMPVSPVQPPSEPGNPPPPPPPPAAAPEARPPPQAAGSGSPAPPLSILLPPSTSSQRPPRHRRRRPSNWLGNWCHNTIQVRPTQLTLSPPDPESRVENRPENRSPPWASDHQ